MPRHMKEKFKTFGDVFDRFTERNLFVLSSKGYFEEDTLSPISIGKEGNVFSAKRGDGSVVVKIYRLETCDFGKMYSYIRPDPRYADLKGKRREIIFAWAQREYRNLLAAREAGVKAPIPIAIMKNILIMEFIGDENPAPKLKDAIPKNKKKFFDEVVKNMQKFYKAGFAHGDLSSFNILNHNESPVFIDFSQAMPLKAPNSDEMIERDCRNIATYFSKLGVKADEEKLQKMLKK
ncbi:serine protein kinase RIO [Candidatus Woesearchaeota archaeon]|nr:serine protein kinase RIO [Candidatus Woesearchaeota archaeon]